MINKNVDPTSRVGNRKVKRAVSGAAISALLVLAGCSTSESSEPAPKTVVPTVSTVPERTTTTLTAEQKQSQAEHRVREEANSYVVSEERSRYIGETVNAAGSRIVELAESGEVGHFDFYNQNTEKWGRGAGNEGYGILQHNLGYGGTLTSVSVAVYQEADGSIDPSTVKSVKIHTEGHPMVYFEAPDFAEKVLEMPPRGTVARGWSLDYVPVSPDGTLDFKDLQTSNPFEQTSVEIQAIDSNAVYSLNAQMAQLTK